MNFKRYIAPVVLAGALAVPAIGSEASAHGGGPVVTGGLVNVTLVNVLNNNEILSRNNVGLGVAANIAANLCVGDVNVAAVIAAIHDDGDFACTGVFEQATGPLTITQAQ